MIWLVTGVIVYQAILRVVSQEFKIEPKAMLITSGCGVLVNILMGATLHQHGHSHGGGSSNSHGHSHGDIEQGAATNKHSENINVSAAFIHVVGDFIQSIGVFIAAIVIFFKGIHQVHNLRIWGLTTDKNALT